jgi:membrane protease YdiL (CAAX protease family)
MIGWVRKHALVSFFCLTYAIAFGVTFAYIALFPGQPSRPWSLSWFLNAFSPTISALILTWMIGGGAGVKNLLSGFTRWKVGLRWYFAAAFLFLGPLAFAWVYGTFVKPGPGIQPGMTLSVLLGQLIFTLFSGPVSEEAGWRGFALPRLQIRFGPLAGTLILGLLWAMWHLPAYFVTGWMGPFNPGMLILNLILTTILTILFTWVFNGSGGVFLIAMLLHASSNASSAYLGRLLPALPPIGSLAIVAALVLVSLLVLLLTRGRLAYASLEQE